MRSGWAVRSAHPPPDCRPDGSRCAARRQNPGGGCPEHRNARWVKPDPGSPPDRLCGCPRRPPADRDLAPPAWTGAAGRPRDSGAAGRPRDSTPPATPTPRPQADLWGSAGPPRTGRGGRSGPLGGRRHDRPCYRRLLWAPGRPQAAENRPAATRLTGLPATKKAPHHGVRGLVSRLFRRRPTLPGGIPPSTIGAGGLNFRVRDGNGCDSAAMATGNRAQCGRLGRAGDLSL